MDEVENLMISNDGFDLLHGGAEVDLHGYQYECSEKWRSDNMSVVKSGD